MHRYALVPFIGANDLLSLGVNDLKIPGANGRGANNLETLLSMYAPQYGESFIIV
jgi:hypothetical protein